MSTDIILADIPFKEGKKTIIYRTEEPEKLTWDFIFAYINGHTGIPIKYLAANDDKGYRIRRKNNSYPPFIYENYRMRTLNGTLVPAAYITIHLIVN